MAESKELMTLDNICNRVYIIRGQQVMLDYDLAEIYGYEVRAMNQQVKRNIDRFPEDFMFQLEKSEVPEKFSKSQFVILNESGDKRGTNIKKMPYAFTEQGVAMLSSVLRSDTAIEINIRIMRTFVSIRNHLYTTQRFSTELEAIKAKLQLLERNDEDNLEAINDLSEDMRKEIDTIYQAIAALSVKEQMQKEQQRQKIGFKTSKDI